jgi:hypothetical protein
MPSAQGEKIIMERKFFARVMVPNRQALLKLRDFDLDLFHATVAATAAVAVAAEAAPGEAAEHISDYSIEGLLSLEEIGKLVDNGYAVLVEAEASARSRALKTMEFKEWLKAMGEG